MTFYLKFLSSRLPHLAMLGDLRQSTGGDDSRTALKQGIVKRSFGFRVTIRYSVSLRAPAPIILKITRGK
jgi:hypothetical protein